MNAKKLILYQSALNKNSSLLEKIYIENELSDKNQIEIDNENEAKINVEKEDKQKIEKTIFYNDYDDNIDDSEKNYILYIE